MKKSILIFVCVYGAASVGLAQADVDLQVDEEFNQVYDTYQGGAPPETALQPIIMAPVGIQRVSRPAPRPTIETQPTIDVMSSPLGTSRADRLRQARQQMEIQTEQKIVERLEAARMEEEKKRGEMARGLFSQEPIVVPVQQPVEMVVPVQSEPQLSVGDVKEELREIVSELRADVDSTPERAGYIHALIGLSEYDSVKNVRGNYSAGVGFGSEIKERVILEGSFIYSNFDIERTDRSYYAGNYGGYGYGGGGGYGYGYGSGSGYMQAGVLQQLDQYNFQAALKYQVLSGSIRPIVGVVTSYVYRKYGDLNYPGSYMNGPYLQYGEIKTSHALDFGFVCGADFVMSEGFTIGLDFRYLTNLYNRTYMDGPTSIMNPPQGSLLEERSYYNLSLNGQFAF